MYRLHYSYFLGAVQSLREGATPPSSTQQASNWHDLAPLLRPGLVNYRFIVLIWTMPSRNARKYYIPNGYYHIYNRGVEKRSIFTSTQDYNVFTKYLKEYLLPKDREMLMSIIANPYSEAAEKDKAASLLRLNNFHNQVQLIAYCLMPNHFHFLIKQNAHNSIDQFMNSLGTRYTMYFNKCHVRVGHLYQGVYKAVEVESDEYLLHLTRYIHKQAVNTSGSPQPSSYECFLGVSNKEWVRPKEILKFFSGKHSMKYEEFMNQEESLDLSKLVLEDE